MPKAGIQVACSTNWKSALVRSNSNHSTADSRKVSSEVQSARYRALRATASGSPRRNRIRTDPTTGRKVTMERIGQSLMVRSPRLPVEIPGHQQHDADQHGEGIVVDVARLQLARPARQAAGERGNAVGT